VVIRNLLAASLVLLAAPLAHAEAAAPSPMQQHMQQMQASMDQLQKTTEPAKRRELMRAHMAQMQAAMGDLHGMMDCRGDDDCGSGMHGGAMMHGSKPEPIEKQMDTMRHRQNAMQRMLEQMLKHQEQMTID
jgi:hypothetical protein